MKRFSLILSLWMLLALAGCGTPPPFHHRYASGYYLSTPEQCVPYARKTSGLRLSGDAYSWWNSAQYRYQRGHTPECGAVLVLKRTPRMRFGHLAVVKDVVDNRQINVTHSNWGTDERSRSIVYESMRAIDVSPSGNWTRIRFWNDEHNSFGAPYDAYGFIYP